MFEFEGTIKVRDDDVKDLKDYLESKGYAYDLYSELVDYIEGKSGKVYHMKKLSGGRIRLTEE